MKLAALMYHDIIASDGARGGFPGAGAALYAVSEADFERQMDGIERALGTPPLRAEEALAGAPAEGGWMLTFDDGGAGATAAGAVLAERGWAAHFFIVTAMVGRPGFLGWDGVRALAAQGHVVGAHSHTHPERIAELPPPTLREEWTRSVAELSEALGAPVRIASVPGGHYSEAVGRTAAAAGIATLFTSQPRRTVAEVDGCALIGRFAVRSSTPASTVAAAASGSAMPWLRQRLGWGTRGVAKRLAGHRYERLRGALLRRR